jgi:hypothetical protein
MKIIRLKKWQTFAGAALVLISMTASPSALAQNRHPFLNYWKADLVNSRLHPTDTFQNLTIDFELSREELIVIEKKIDAEGKERRRARLIRTDNEAWGVYGAPGAFATACWDGSQALEEVITKGEQVISQSKYQVSEDGNMLTLHTKEIEEGGEVIERLIVFYPGTRPPSAAGRICGSVLESELVSYLKALRFQWY